MYQKRVPKGTPRRGGQFAEGRKPQGAELKTSRTDEVLAELSAGVRSLSSSERWTEYLDVQSKFHSYSFGNTVLILSQRPQASRVAGYKKWQELGRQVKKGEHQIMILAPVIKKVESEDHDPQKEERRLVGFRSVGVFDESQTEGDPLPTIAPELEGVAPEGQFQSLTDVAASFGFTVEKVSDSVIGTANGDCNPTTKHIRVKDSNSGQQQVKTLAHELGHALLHDADSDLPRDHKEIEAESVAYVVSKALGIDSSGYSFGYVTSWSRGDPDEAEKKIKESGARIQKAAHQIIDSFAKVGV